MPLAFLLRSVEAELCQELAVHQQATQTLGHGCREDTRQIAARWRPLQWQGFPHPQGLLLSPLSGVACRSGRALHTPGCSTKVSPLEALAIASARADLPGLTVTSAVLAKAAEHPQGCTDEQRSERERTWHSWKQTFYFCSFCIAVA